MRLLFQPSEEAQDAEGKSGGMRMVEEGALKGLDAVFGLHVSPKTKQALWRWATGRFWLPPMSLN